MTNYQWDYILFGLVIFNIITVTLAALIATKR